MSLSQGAAIYTIRESMFDDKNLIPCLLVYTEDILAVAAVYNSFHVIDANILASKIKIEAPRQGAGIYVLPEIEWYCPIMGKITLTTNRKYEISGYLGKVVIFTPNFPPFAVG